MDITERNELIKSHLPYIRMVANRYKKLVDVDDLIQEGILGLLRATDTFDASKNIKFLTYASYWINCYIIRYIKKDSKYLPMNDQDQFLGNRESIKFTELEDKLIYRELQEKTYDELTKSGVSTRDLDIVLSRYLSEDPCTLQELGDKYGVSRERIRQIEERMIKKIKQKLLE